METQVQLDQPGDGVDVGAGIAQRLHALAGHASADDLVVMEGHAAGAERPRLRLPDVVEEGGEAQQPIRTNLLHHGDGVGEHVLVTLDGVLLERQRRQLRQELFGQPGLHEEPQALARARLHQQLVELVADALCGHDLEPPAQVAHGVDKVGVRPQVVAGDEAGGAQHPQGVVGERLRG